MGSSKKKVTIKDKEVVKDKRYISDVVLTSFTTKIKVKGKEKTVNLVDAMLSFGEAVRDLTVALKDSMMADEITTDIPEEVQEEMDGPDEEVNDAADSV